MKIQLKHSQSVLRGEAVVPTVMEPGELAVNYNSTDPTIFLQDSQGQVIEIASKNATAQGMLWTNSGSSLYPTYLESNVGIGTTNPSAPLTIENSRSAEIKLIKSNAGNSFSSIAATGSTSQFLTISSAATGTIDFKVGNTLAAQMNSSGNLGVKKQNPSVELDVAGSGKFTGKVTSAATVEADPSQTLVTKGYVDGTISGNITGAAKWKEVDNKLYPTTIGNNVGIGLENPAEKLDVNGNVKINGRAYYTSPVDDNDLANVLADKIYVDTKDVWEGTSNTIHPKNLGRNVGIGTDFAECALDVYGDIAAFNFRIDLLDELD